MKKLALKTATVITAMNTFASSVFANSAIIDPSLKPEASPGGTLGGNITLILNYFLGLLGLVAVAMLIYAGVLMVTAGGNDEQVGKARKIITYSVIGIIIVLLSYSIVSFVSGALG